MRYVYHFPSKIHGKRAGNKVGTVLVKDRLRVNIDPTSPFKVGNLLSYFPNE